MKWGITDPIQTNINLHDATTKKMHHGVQIMWAGVAIACSMLLSQYLIGETDGYYESRFSMVFIITAI
jgi:hypothetical protein